MVCHLLPFARVGQIYQNIPLLFHYEITQYVMFWDDVILHSTYTVICKLEYTGTLCMSLTKGKGSTQSLQQTFSQKKNKFCIYLSR